MFLRIRSVCVILVVCSLLTVAEGATVRLQWDANPESNVIGYHVYRSLTSGGGYQRLSGSTVAGTSFTDPNGEAGRTYYYVATAVNSQGLESGFSNQISVSIPAAPVNQPPVAQAGPDQSVTSGDMVRLSGQGSDPEGGSLSFRWQQISGPAAQLSTPSAVSPTFVAPDVSVTSTLTFRLTVTDPQGATGTDTVAIQVNPRPQGVNEPPTVLLNERFSVFARSVVEIGATATDPEGDPLTYSWVQTAGPAVRLSSPREGRITVHIPSLSAGHQIRLKVTVEDGVNVVEAHTLLTVRAGSALLFPSSVSDMDPGLDSSFVGVAFANTVGRPNRVVLSNPTAGGGTPVAVEIPTALEPHGQQAFLTQELDWEINGGTMLRAEGLSGEVQGLFMIGDYDLTMMDGISGRLEASEQLFFALPRPDDARRASLFLYNDEKEEAFITVSVFDDTGQLVKDSSHSLTSGVHLSLSHAELLPSSLDRAGHVRVNATSPVSGFLLSLDDRSLSALPGRASESVQRLLAPYFYVGPDDDTEVQLLNSGRVTAQVAVRALSERGDLLAEGRAILAPGQSWSSSVRNLLPSGSYATTPVSGYLTVEVTGSDTGFFSDPPELLGSLSFSGNQGRQRSSLAMPSSAHTSFLFPHLVQSEEAQLYTGLALANHGLSPALVQVKAFDQEGRLTASRELIVGAGQQSVDLLNGKRLFGKGFSQLGGHLEVTSSQPITAWALFGDSSREFLSAIGSERIDLE